MMTLTPWLSKTASSAATSSTNSSTYASPEQPVVRTPRRTPSPLPRPSRERRTCCAAASVMLIAMTPSSEQTLLVLVIAHGRLDGVLGEYRAVNFHRRQGKLFSDHGVFQRSSFIQGFALHPLGGQRARGNRRAATVGLELGVFDDACVVDLDLQAHHVTTGRSADHAGADIRIFGIKLANVARVFVVVDDLFTVSHGAIPLCSRAGVWDSVLVRLPFNLTEVDALFVHIPQRRQFTQLDHRFANLLCGVIDIFFGGEAAKGKANRAMRQLIVTAQGTQHVGRLQGSRGTGRTGRHRQVLEGHDQRLAFDVVEAQVQVVRNTLSHAAVDIELLHVFNLSHETLAQRQYMVAVLL